LGLLRGLEFTFLRNLRFLKNVGNDKSWERDFNPAPLLPKREKGLGMRASYRKNVRTIVLRSMD